MRPRDVLALFAFPSRPRADTPGRGVAPNTCGSPERELDIFRSIAPYAHAASNAKPAMESVDVMNNQSRDLTVSRDSFQTRCGTKYFKDKPRCLR